MDMTILIDNKKHAIARYDKLVPIDFSLYRGNKISLPWKLNVKFCFFLSHGSGEIFPVMNNLSNKQHL